MRQNVGSTWFTAKVMCQAFRDAYQNDGSSALKAPEIGRLPARGNNCEARLGLAAEAVDRY